MSAHGYEDLGDLSTPEPNGELVHWMPNPLAVGPTGVSLAAVGAFALGAAATLAVLALTHWLGPQRGRFGFARRR